MRHVPTRPSPEPPPRPARKVLLPGAPGPVLLAAVLLILAAGGPLRGLVYTVSSLGDSGSGSLREAISNADGTLANDVITFNVSGTIALSTSLPAVADAATGGTLTIDGGGAITIDGGSSMRVLTVATGGDLTLESLSVTSGSDPSGGGGDLQQRVSGSLSLHLRQRPVAQRHGRRDPQS